MNDQRQLQKQPSNENHWYQEKMEDEKEAEEQEQEQQQQQQFSVGSVEGVPFTACTSGPDIIILASNFSRVQQITASSPISSLDCSTDVGKIAAAYNNKMVIFEPIPLVQQQQTPACVSKLDYKWVQTATIESDKPISVMSFNLEGTRLIAGGQTLQLWVVDGSSKTNWQCVWRCKTASNITYLKYSPDGTLFCSASKSDRLVKIWYESVTNPPSLSMSNSNVFNDLSATTLSTPNCLSPPPAFNGSAPTFTVTSANNSQHNGQMDHGSSNLLRPKFDFSFIYIAHPLPVTGTEWRRTSKYTPRGAVANILITSCKDNIARVWVQTLLPDDGLVNFHQLKSSNCEEDLLNGAPRVQTQRHRQKLLRRLKRMKAFSQFKKRQALALDHSLYELEKVADTATTTFATAPVISNNPDASATLQTSNSSVHLNGLVAQTQSNSTSTNSMPTALSAHDFHTYSICSTVIKPGLHFHLAGIIEAGFEADTLSSSSAKVEAVSHSEIEREDVSPQFVVHWINNKEIHITRSIELLLHDMLIRILRGNIPTSISTNSPQSAGESCSGSENDTDDLDDPNDDTITAESSKKLRHKLCRKMNKERALAASGRRTYGDIGDPTNPSGRNSLDPNLSVNNNGRASPTSLVEEFDKTLESLLKKWQTSADLLFSINKSDGTLTLWQVKYLDGEDAGVFRQVQIDKLSHLRSALPHYDATTMSLNVTAYSPSAYLDVKRAYLAVTNTSTTVVSSSSATNFLVGDQFSPVDVPEILSINTDSANISLNQSIKNDVGESLNEFKDNVSASSITDVDPSIFIVTQHLSGILGLWKLNFDSTYPKVQSVDLVTRITGLPIDPAWLRDGTLTVEYMDESCTLVTGWLPDERGKKFKPRISGLTSSPASKPNPFSFEEIKSSLICALPSVDEEATPKQPTCEQKESTRQEESHQIDIKDSYRASQIASDINLLPQYHLKQLIELLAFGKLQRVKAILNHLVNCLVLHESNHEKDTDTSNPVTPWAHRSRTLSIVAQSPPPFQKSFDIDNQQQFTIQQQVMEEIELDYIEVTSIRPLPLYLLLDADDEKSYPSENNSKAREEFSTDYESILRSRSQVDETLDEILGQSTIETLNKQKEREKLARSTIGKGSLTSFNPKKAELLTQVLTHTHLPGLTNVDQMHLLAVADAVALFDASPEDLNDLHDEESYNNSSGGAISIVTTNIAIDSLDDRGLRFLTAMRQHVYLARCLPMKQRNELKANGIGNPNLVWAFHSETQDELVSLIPCVQRNKPEWAELREFGVGWWLKKLEVLKRLIEKVAQSAYQARQDPLDAALFYLAMKKKTLVCALLRRVNCDKRLLKLFEQDFNDPVNRKKALKNAYALLGLHRFEHAAAFFILAGSIWDAVEVCINNLNDIQLAMILIRLYDNDMNVPNNLRKLLFTEILGSKRPTETPMQQDNATKNYVSDRKLSQSTLSQYSYDPKRAHPDPFLRSMAFWKLSDYLSAVHTILESSVGQQRHRQQSSLGISPQDSANSRRNSDALNSNNQIASDAADGQLNLRGGGPAGGAEVSVSASVFNFYLFLKDQPLVVKQKQQLLEEMELKKRTNVVDEEQVHCHRARSLSSGELGFDESEITRAIKQSSTEFEVLNETTRLVDKYSDEATAEKERRLFFSTANAYLEAGCPLLALEVLCSEDHLNMNKAQRMKFVACLHILMNELNTLASTSHVVAGTTSHKFGIQFFEWLQKSVEAMKKICSYAGTCHPFVLGKQPRDGKCESADGDLMADFKLSRHVGQSNSVRSPTLENQRGQMGAVAQDDVGEGDDMNWVKMNEPILRVMLTYCNLHSAVENSLTTIRLELLSLLKKLPSS